MITKYLTMEKEISLQAATKIFGNVSAQANMKIKPKYSTDAYKGTNKLLNKYAVISLGDNGVAKAVSIAFAKEGAHVVLVYNHHKYESEIKAVAKIIERLGRNVWIIKACTFEEFKCKRLFESILKKVKKIDILVNMFAISNKKDSETGHYLLRKNDTLKLQSLFTLGRIAPEFMAQNGIIINSATLCSYALPDQLIFYAALKAAIKTYSQEMNRILSVTKRKLRVNGITTGLIWTPHLPTEVTQYNHTSNTMQALAPLHPYEVAPLYVFIASDEAKAIAGETLDAGGKGYRS